MMFGISRRVTSSCAGAALLILLVAIPAGAVDVAVVDRAAGLPSDGVLAIAVDDGNVWLGLGNRGVALWNAGRRRVTDFSGEGGFTSRDISSIAVFGGKVYAGTARELMVYDGKTWKRLEKVENVTLRNVVLAAPLEGKELWACALTLAGGTVRLDGEKWTFMGGGGRGLFNDISSFAFGKDGTWMGSVSGTVYLHKGATVDYFREGISGSVFALAEANGVVYAGTRDGLFRLEGKAWKRVPFPPAWGNQRVSSMAVSGGKLYLATPGGLGKLESGRFERLTVAEGLPATSVAVVAASADVVYAGTSKGLAVVRGW